MPAFDRDKEARNPRRRARRQVQDLSIELIEHLIAHANPHLAAQLWTEWSTGARVSSILHGCLLSDLILAPGREQITFRPNSTTGRGMKNGETVTAHLHPRAAEALRRYLEVRGRRRDREGPLFLTPRRRPYSENSYGVQNKTAFKAMKRRARAALRRQQMAKARSAAPAAARHRCQAEGRAPAPGPHHTALVPPPVGHPDARRYPRRHGSRLVGSMNAPSWATRSTFPSITASWSTN